MVPSNMMLTYIWLYLSLGNVCSGSLRHNIDYIYLIMFSFGNVCSGSFRHNIDYFILVLVVSVADGPSKQELVDYQIPINSLQPFHQYHLELVKASRSV